MPRTSRNFEYQDMVDDSGIKYSIQQSSSFEPHIWLGPCDPIIETELKSKNFMSGIVIKKEKGKHWKQIILPDNGTIVHSRMHLNQSQARELAMMLLTFADTGHLFMNGEEE